MVRKALLSLIVCIILGLTSACSVPTPGQVIQNVVMHVNLGELAPLPAAQPSADVVQLADDAGMTDAARAIFYAAQPEIDADHQVFNQNCQTLATSRTAELGCFTSAGRIFILKISDPRLSSEMVVVAVHEMLHAAYEQLSPAQQASVNALIEKQVLKIRDAKLAERLMLYSQTEPGQQDNELHSILGSEYAPLSSELEQYYSQYFTNRTQVVSDSRSFDAVFNDLQNTLSSLENQISRLHRQMRLDLARHNLSAYNRLVPQFNAAVDQFNQEVRIYNNLSNELIQEVTPASQQ
jgi:hypothetical protein